MNAHETARAIARSDIAAALRDPKTTPQGLLVLKRGVDLADAALELATARAEAAAELRVEQARFAAEAREVAAAKAKAEREDAARHRIAGIVARFNELRDELAEASVADGVKFPTALSLEILRVNRPIGSTAEQARVFDLAATLGMETPEVIEARRAIAASNADAWKAGTAQLTKWSEGAQAAAKLQEAVFVPGAAPKRDALAGRGNVLN